MNCSLWLYFSWVLVTRQQKGFKFLLLQSTDFSVR